MTPPTIDLKDRNVLILGLGRNRGGAGVAKWAAARGARLRITDLRDEAALRPSLEELAHVPCVEYVLGRHREEDVEWADVVIRNPAVPRESRMLELAREQDKPILMEMAIFALETEAPIIGITGTKGKTLTANVTHELLRAAGRRVAMVGNMGIPALDHTGLDRGAVVVAEISSFHVEGMHEVRVSPAVAVVTNLAEDHLDRYDSTATYYDVKASMLDFQSPQDWAILPWDSPHRDLLERRVRGRSAYFAAGGERPDGANAVWSDGTSIQMAWDGEEGAISSVDAIPHRGSHNVANVCAAIAAVLAVGVAPEEIATALPALEQVPNRLEPIATIDEVEYINDTTATTPAAAAAAVAAFPDRDLVLIAGGGDKGLDQAVTAEAVVRGARAVVLLPGAATGSLVAELQARGYSDMTGPVQTMREAVETARRLARPGGVVVLSPGATSFTLFLDEFDRGGQFRRAVEAQKASE